MKKERSVSFLVLIIILSVVFSLSFVSAGWFGDVFGKITGRALDSSGNLEPAWCEGADFNKDGKVNVGDMAMFSSCYNKNLSENPNCTITDINEDGKVNVGDLAIISKHYGYENCTAGEEEIPAICTDSDGGLNPYVYGFTHFTKGSFELEHFDECALVFDYDVNGTPSGWQSTDSCSGEDCYVEEAFCRVDENGSFIDADADQLIGCFQGCANGTCKPGIDVLWHNYNFYPSLAEIGSIVEISESLEVDSGEVDLLPDTRKITLIHPDSQEQTLELAISPYSPYCYGEFCYADYNAQYSFDKLGVYSIKESESGYSGKAKAVKKGYFAENLVLHKDSAYSLYYHGDYHPYDNSENLRAGYYPYGLDDAYDFEISKYPSEQEAEIELNKILSEAPQFLLSNSQNVNGNVVYVFKTPSLLRESGDIVFWKSGNSLISGVIENRQEDKNISIQDFVNALSGQTKQEDIYLNYYDLPYLFRTITEQYFDIYPSDLIEENCYSAWECETLPLICPEYGKQTQTCRDRGSCGKQKIIIEKQCQPGVCSGCMLAKANDWDISRSVPDGFRMQEELQDQTIGLNNGEKREIGTYLVRAEVLDSSSVIININDELTFELDEGQSYKMTNVPITIYVNKIVYQAFEGGEQYVELYLDFSSENVFCDVDGKTYSQKQNTGDCQNNFECLSNQCSDGVCVGLVEEVRGQTNLLIKIWCKLTNLFDQQAYEQCVITYTPPSSGGGGGSGSGEGS